jgi:pSer/pThr/pTyr-binding forkhead associated (FHA) protein
MKIELTAVDSRKRKIVVDQLPVIVGLDPGSDICLDDSAVGHHQCMIDDGDGDDGLMLWDLGTKSGTFINGVRVVKKHPLSDGDELTIGRSTFLVNYEHDGQHFKPRSIGSSQPQRTALAKPVAHAREAVVT